MEKWESEQMWPAHEVLKKLGSAGLLGVNKPVEYGGLGLDWKYNLAVLGISYTFYEFFKSSLEALPSYSSHK